MAEAGFADFAEINRSRHNREHMMSTNEQVVRNFIEAWSRLDPAELAGFFHELKKLFLFY